MPSGHSSCTIRLRPHRYSDDWGYTPRAMIEATPVSRLVRYLKDLLESNLRLSNLWVEGEISNLSRSTRGHVYFSLKDEDTQLRCVMFQRQYRGAPLENGAQVLAH